jgi:hypothetical protein
MTPKGRYFWPSGAMDDVRAALAEFECGGVRDCVRADLIFQRYFRWHELYPQRARCHRLKVRQFGQVLKFVFPGIKRERFARRLNGGRRYWYRGLRWKDTDARTFVSDHHHRLDDRRAMRIRELWGDGLGVSELAVGFGLGQTTVRRILSGERWRNTPAGPTL